MPVIGLGCMGMTGFEEAHMYGPADEQEAIATIHRSLELGSNQKEDEFVAAGISPGI